MHGRRVDTVLIEDDSMSLGDLLVAPRRTEPIDTMLIEATAEAETESIIAI